MLRSFQPIDAFLRQHALIIGSYSPSSTFFMQLRIADEPPGLKIH
ncbi:hypothetical protein S7335_4017 [Synechococcus sp. PCC 7335]|nr:hypothetical protein S7335_4017 [Synechococcus sp. PCC 7335]